MQKKLDKNELISFAVSELYKSAKEITFITPELYKKYIDALIGYTFSPIEHKTEIYKEILKEDFVKSFILKSFVNIIEVFKDDSDETRKEIIQKYGKDIKSIAVSQNLVDLSSAIFLHGFRYN